jgi:tripartite-type tricarboxylate transporter receptor subunit TctC
MSVQRWSRLVRAAVVLAGAAWITGLAGTAAAQFPDKAVTIVVNFAPGGARDIVARGLVKTMSRHLGAPMVVLNKPGGAGALGIASVYGAAPDGYTLGLGGSAESIAQVLDKQEYDVTRFTYLGRVESSPIFLYVKGDSPFKSIADFERLGRPVRHGTFSVTAQQTVAAIIISQRKGFPLLAIGGYKGSAGSLLGLVRGEVEFVGTPESAAASFLQNGQVRPVLTIGHDRAPSAPAVPTVTEAGFPELAALGLELWLMAPPGLPADRTRVLEAALTKTLADPEFRTWAASAKLNISPLAGEPTRQMIVKQLELFRQYKGEIEKYVKKEP